ncbi:MAG TPA: hypothetical protein VFI31_24860 [Pirellulales bacterium]|nr:hypothetical protein [Pirellulales bacterium]
MMSEEPSTAEFDPYTEWLGIAPGLRPPAAHDLLGLAVGEGNAEAIRKAATARSAEVRKYCLGSRGTVATRLLGELASAQNTLIAQIETVHDTEPPPLLPPMDEAPPLVPRPLPLVLSPLPNSPATNASRRRARAAPDEQADALSKGQLVALGAAGVLGSLVICFLVYGILVLPTIWGNSAAAPQTSVAATEEGQGRPKLSVPVAVPTKPPLPRADKPGQAQAALSRPMSGLPPTTVPSPSTEGDDFPPQRQSPSPAPPAPIQTAANNRPAEKPVVPQLTPPSAANGSSSSAMGPPGAATDRQLAGPPLPGPPSKWEVDIELPSGKVLSPYMAAVRINWQDWSRWPATDPGAAPNQERVQSAIREACKVPFVGNNGKRTYLAAYKLEDKPKSTKRSRVMRQGDFKLAGPAVVSFMEGKPRLIAHFADDKPVRALWLWDENGSLELFRRYHSGERFGSTTSLAGSTTTLVCRGGLPRLVVESGTGVPGRYVVEWETGSPVVSSLSDDAVFRAWHALEASLDEELENLHREFARWHRGGGLTRAKQAASKLGGAKLLLKAAGKLDRAKASLREVVDEFADTDAADEAQKLLDELE